MKYANDIKVESVLFVEEEFDKKMSLKVKNMETGIQQLIKLTDL
jgi:histidyl-tRNA synthetase